MKVIAKDDETQEPQVSREDELKKMRKKAEKGDLDEMKREKETYIDEQDIKPRGNVGFSKRKFPKKKIKQSLVDDVDV